MTLKTLFADWHPLNSTIDGTLDNKFVIVECDRERNNVTIIVNKTVNSYMVHSCWDIQLSVIGQGNENIDLVILSVQTVTVNNISVKKINMYTDAKTTCVNQFKSPLKHFQISAPGTEVVIDKGNFDNGQTLAITNANHILIKDTILKHATVNTSFASEVEFNNSNLTNISWQADQVQHIKIVGGSVLGVNLIQFNTTVPEQDWVKSTDLHQKQVFNRIDCRFQGGFLERNFCPDTTIDISSGSYLNNHTNTNGGTTVTKAEIFLAQEDNCKHKCFGSDSVQSKLIRSAMLNDVTQMDLLFKNFKNTTGLLPIAVKRNAYNAVRYLIEKQDVDVNEKDEYDRTALFFAAWDDLIDVAKLLLQHGADVNVTGNFFHSTPLIWTGEKDAYRVAKLLIDNNADRSDHSLNCF